MKKEKEKKYIPLVPEKEKNSPQKFKHSAFKIYIGFWTRMLASFIVFFIVLIASFILLKNSLDIVEINKIEINETSNLDYRVYLNENNTYENTYLEKDMAYVTTLIDKIEANLKYNLSVNTKSNLNFKYQIFGDLIIEDQEDKDKVYYNKTHKLSDELKDNIVHLKDYEIDKTIFIDYWYYNGFAEKFKEEHKVNTKSYLNVYIKVETESSEANFYEYKSTTSPSIIIPLAEDSIKIETNNINNKESVGDKPEISIKSKPLLALTLVLFLVSLLILTQIILNIIHLRPKKTKYDKIIDKILKENDEIIINTTTPPEKTNKRIIRVETFKELQDAYNNLKEPIKYHIVSAHNKCEFYLDHNNELYILTIKSVDLESK